MQDTVLFYVHPRYYFDNFQCYRITLDNYTYRTTEHAYQSLRFRDTAPNIADLIMNAASPHEAKKLKKQYYDKINPQYVAHSPHLIPLMKRILIAKFEQHEDVRVALAKTGNSVMAEDSPTDSFRGIGADGTGANHLGKLWMEIRTQYLT